MRSASLRSRRLVSHRLSAPAADPALAAGHMLAVQAQEFWGARWALAVRSRRAPTLADVDAAFERGELVRSWTMRGTLHIVQPRDLAWLLGVTGARQRRQHAPVHRAIGIDDEVIARAERAARAALRGGGRLTRTEFGEVLRGAGIDPAEMRGSHLISALAEQLVVCWGPVVERTGTPSREQHLVLVDEWIAEHRTPADPLAEMFVRYLDGHAPAGIRDFGWWAALPLGLAREAVERAGDRITRIDDDLYVPASAPPRRSTSDAASALALPPFDEYFLSYAARDAVCAPEFVAHVGPSLNGMVKPVLVRDGAVVGIWAHSMAAGRHRRRPAVELFDRGEPDAQLRQAVERFTAFVAG